MYLTAIFLFFIFFSFSIISYYYIKKYHQKKIQFLEKDILRLNQVIIEKQYVIEVNESKSLTLQDEIISLKAELTNNASTLFQKEKEINSLRILLESLKKKNELTNDDIFIEFPTKQSS